MTAGNTVSVVLNRAFEPRDESAVYRLMGRWLAYDVSINRRRRNTEIKFYYSEKARPQLLEGISEFFPEESLTEM